MFVVPKSNGCFRWQPTCRVGVLLVVFGNAQSLAAPNLEEVLANLRAKDDQFDNAALTYTESGVAHDEGFPTWQYPGLAEKYKLPPEASQPRDVPVRFHGQLIVRRDDATFIRDADPSLIPDKLVPGMVLPMAHTKWSNTKGMQREISNGYPEGHEKSDRTLEIAASGPEGDIAQEQRMATEFSLGMGFGKRIEKITSVTQDADGLLVLEGTMRTWPRANSTFRAKVDSQLVVREAEIEARVDEALNVLSIRTEGSREQANMVLPAKGSFKRTTWATINGQRLGNGKVITEFNIAFEAMRLNLSDEEYDRLTNMDVPVGTFVIDKIAGISYVKKDTPANLSDSVRAAVGGQTQSPQPASRTTTPTTKAGSISADVASRRHQRTVPGAGQTSSGSRVYLGVLAFGALLTGLIIYWAKRRHGTEGR